VNFRVIKRNYLKATNCAGSQSTAVTQSGAVLKREVGHPQNEYECMQSGD
jgi:hypothetical protein